MNLKKILEEEDEWSPEEIEAKLAKELDRLRSLERAAEERRQKIRDGNMDTYIYPTVMSRWKKWVEMRKKYKKAISVCDTLSEDKMRKFFARWKNHFENREAIFKADKKAELVKKGSALLHLLDSGFEKKADQDLAIEELNE